MSVRGVTAELLAAAREHGAPTHVQELLSKAVKAIDPYGAAAEKLTYNALMYVLGAAKRKPKPPRDGGNLDTLCFLFHPPEEWTDWDHRLLDLWRMIWKENALTLWGHFQGMVRERPRDDVFGALYRELRKQGFSEQEILHGMLHPLAIGTVERRSGNMVSWVRDYGEPTSLARWIRAQLPERYRALADMTRKHGGSWIGFPLVLVRLAPDLFEEHADEFTFPKDDSELRRTMLLTALLKHDARRFGARALKLAMTLTDPDLKLDAGWSLMKAFPKEACELALAAAPKLRHASARARAITLLLEVQKAQALPHLALLRDPDFFLALGVLKVAERVAGDQAVPAIVDCLLAPHDRGSEYAGVKFTDLIDELCDLLDRHDLGGLRERIELAFSDEKSARVRERIRKLVSGKSKLPPEPKPSAPKISYAIDDYAEQVRAASLAAIRASLPKSIEHLKLATENDGVLVTAVAVNERLIPLKLAKTRVGDPKPLATLLKRHGQRPDPFDWGSLSKIPSMLVLIELIGAAHRLASDLQELGVRVAKIDVGDPESSWFDAKRLAEAMMDGSKKMFSRPGFVDEFSQLFYATDERRSWFKELV